MQKQRSMQKSSLVHSLVNTSHFASKHPVHLPTSAKITQPNSTPGTLRASLKTRHPTKKSFTRSGNSSLSLKVSSTTTSVASAKITQPNSAPETLRASGKTRHQTRKSFTRSRNSSLSLKVSSTTTSVGNASPRSLRNHSAGAIGGGITGAVLIIGILVALILFLYKRRRKNSRDDASDTERGVDNNNCLEDEMRVHNYETIDDYREGSSRVKSKLDMDSIEDGTKTMDPQYTHLKPFTTHGNYEQLDSGLGNLSDRDSYDKLGIGSPYSQVPDYSILYTTAPDQKVAETGYKKVLEKGVGNVAESPSTFTHGTNYSDSEKSIAAKTGLSEYFILESEPSLRHVSDVLATETVVTGPPEYSILEEACGKTSLTENLNSTTSPSEASGTDTFDNDITGPPEYSILEKKPLTEIPKSPSRHSDKGKTGPPEYAISEKAQGIGTTDTQIDSRETENVIADQCTLPEYSILEEQSTR